MVSQPWRRNMWLAAAFLWLAFLGRGFIENPVYSTLVLYAFLGFGIPITIAVVAAQATDAVRKHREDQ
jgi:hypothetical protein